MTRYTFEDKLRAINEKLGTNYEIDNDTYCGGRLLCKFNSDGAQSNLRNNRMASKVFDAYLIGMLEVLDIQQRKRNG